MINRGFDLERMPNSEAQVSPEQQDKLPRTEPKQNRLNFVNEVDRITPGLSNEVENPKAHENKQHRPPLHNT